MALAFVQVVPFEFHMWSTVFAPSVFLLLDRSSMVCPNCPQVPAHVVITRDFTMKDFWNDRACSIGLWPTSYTILDFFKAEEWPFVKLIKTDVEDGKTAKKTLYQLLKDIGMHKAPEPESHAGAQVVSDVRKSKQATRTSEARTEMETRRKARIRSKTVSFAKKK